MRKRSGILATVLAYFSPPVAFAYVQKPSWGIAVLVSGPLLLLLAGWLGIAFRPGGYIALLSIMGLVVTASMIAAFLCARRLPEGTERKWYNRWYHYAWLAAMTFVFAYFVGINRGALFGYEPFRIPSSAMQPTLLPGDFIIADFRARTMSDIDRGDIVVFEPSKYPDQRWIKRVVGLPDDLIDIRGNEVFANGKSVRGAWKTVSKPESLSPVPYGHVRLGSDEYYLMGDNRPNSEDSRFTGPVKRSALVAKASSIWFHYSPISHSIDTSRIGRIDGLPTRN